MIKQQREQERKFDEEVKAAYEAERKNQPASLASVEWEEVFTPQKYNESEPVEEKISADVEPVEEKISADVEPVEEKISADVEPVEEKISAEVEPSHCSMQAASPSSLRVLCL